MQVCVELNNGDTLILNDYTDEKCDHLMKEIDLGKFLTFENYNIQHHASSNTISAKLGRPTPCHNEKRIVPPTSIFQIIVVK